MTATPDGELDPATAPAPVLPTYWQCAPCPACGQKSWAVPWEPRAVCLRCNGPLQVDVKLMCPHCGLLFGYADLRDRLIPGHAVRGYKTGMYCPGSNQNPRNPETDRRPLWKELPDGRKPTPHEAAPGTGIAAVPHPEEEVDVTDGVDAETVRACTREIEWLDDHIARLGESLRAARERREMLLATVADIRRRVVPPASERNGR